MGIANIVTDVILREGGKIIDNVVTSEHEKGQLKVELAKVSQAVELKALDERIAFAQHPSIFVAGGRPFIIWAAGVGIGVQFVAIPLANILLKVLSPETPAVETMDWDNLLVLAGLAGGTSWVRHMDKVRGVGRATLAYPDPSDMAIGAAARGDGGLY